MSSTANGGNGNTKIAFTLNKKKKNKSSSLFEQSKSSNKNNTAVPDGFEKPSDDVQPNQDDFFLNPDIPREPLVIPVQRDGRESLQEQARQRREHSQQSLTTAATANADEVITQKEEEGKVVKEEEINEEDRAAIEALKAEAANGAHDGTSNNTSNSKMVIQGSDNTFQRQEERETEQFQQDLERLAPEVPVESHVYKQVRISEFGAAMLRGMGWTGSVNTSTNDKDSFALPRPSRLGLGATPKLLLDGNSEAPATHSNTRRRPRRQDQVKRDQQLKQQQEEYEKQRQVQIKMDRQRTMQTGSIVRVIVADNHDNHEETIKKNDVRRAIIRQWLGVPGLNMILIQYEGTDSPTKVKKGSVELIDRTELERIPFVEPDYARNSHDNADYLGAKTNTNEKDNENTDKRRGDRDRDRKEDRHGRSSHHDKDRPQRREEEEEGRRRQESNDRRKHDDHTRRHRSDERDRKHSRQEQDGDRRDDHRKRRRREEKIDKESTILSRSKTWLIPNIRVRVVSSRMGSRYYKEKGVVVDVTANGTATLNLTNGEVLQVPERYLETALPKVGANACILTGEHRWAKGRLLERDSKANRGVVQIFEDMNILTTSLDDMAEWCGPLDDDLME